MTETYTLRLLVDDSAVRSLERRINAIMGISGTGAQGGGPRSASGVLAKLGRFLENSDNVKELFNSASIKKFLKLTTIISFIPIILTVLNSIKDSLVNSSPMLAGMLKIMGQSLTLFLRPFGDFLGHFLRPMAVSMINFAAQWYDTMGPIAQSVGSFLGENAKFLSPITGVADAIDRLHSFLTGDEKFKMPSLEGLSLPTLPDITGWLSELASRIAGFFEGLGVPPLEEITGWFVSLGEKIAGFPIIPTLSGWFGTIREKFKEFEVINRISLWFRYVANKIRNFLSGDDVPSVLLGAFGAITGTIREIIDSGRITELINDAVSALISIIKNFPFGRLITGIMNAIRTAFEEWNPAYQAGAAARQGYDRHVEPHVSNAFDAINDIGYETGRHIQGFVESFGRNRFR